MKTRDIRRTQLSFGNWDYSTFDIHINEASLCQRFYVPTGTFGAREVEHVGILAKLESGEHTFYYGK